MKLSPQLSLRLGVLTLIVLLSSSCILVCLDVCISSFLTFSVEYFRLPDLEKWPCLYSQWVPQCWGPPVSKKRFLSLFFLKMLHFYGFCRLYRSSSVGSLCWVPILTRVVMVMIFSPSVVHLGSLKRVCSGGLSDLCDLCHMLGV
jgi:hypothetical protein